MIYNRYIHGLFAAIELPVYRISFENYPQSFANTHTSPESQKLSQFQPAVLLALYPGKHHKAIKEAALAKALIFAQQLKLYVGDLIEMTGSESYGVVRLPDKSLVLIGPLNYPTKPSIAAASTADSSAAARSTTSDSAAAHSTATDSTYACGTAAGYAADDSATNNTDGAGGDALEGMYLNQYNTQIVGGEVRTSKESEASEGKDSAEGARKDSAAGARKDSAALKTINAMRAMKLRMVNLWLSMIGQIVVHDEMPSEDENLIYQEADAFIPSDLKKITKEVKLKAPHNQYRYELAILDAIAQGDEDKVERAFKIPLQGKFGVLGPTPLRSMQNHVHNLNTLSSRAAIKAGILPEKAFALSDKFFMAAEECLTVEQCLQLRTIVAKSFASMVKDYKSSMTTQPPPLVTNALSLISRSLFSPCTVQSLAASLKVTPEHLEKVFKKSMGSKISHYLMQEKIKQAQELLSYTDESISDIAQLLCFSSQSHFITKFKDHTGLTPKQFRHSNHQAPHS